MGILNYGGLALLLAFCLAFFAGWLHLALRIELASFWLYRTQGGWGWYTGGFVHTLMCGLSLALVLSTERPGVALVLPAERPCAPPRASDLPCVCLFVRIINYKYKNPINPHLGAVIGRIGRRQSSSLSPPERGKLIPL